MEKQVIFLVCMLIAVIVSAQNQTKDESKITAPELKREFYSSIDNYLSSNVVHPAKLRNIRMEGTEVVRFVVTSKGNITDFEVINGLSPVFDNHVIQILKETNGKWNPGTANGVPVSMKKEVSIMFYLTSVEDMIHRAKKYQEKGDEWMFVKNNSRKALNCYNRANNLLPNDENILASRSLCKYQLGDKTGAAWDWERLKVLANKRNHNYHIEEFAERPDLPEGFEEIIQEVNK